MVVLMLLGWSPPISNCQDEDPPFAFRVMVVRLLAWGPAKDGRAGHRQDRAHAARGAYADKICSYTKPGESLTLLMVVRIRRLQKKFPTSGTRCEKMGDMRHP